MGKAVLSVALILICSPILIVGVWLFGSVADGTWRNGLLLDAGAIIIGASLVISYLILLFRPLGYIINRKDTFYNNK